MAANVYDVMEVPSALSFSSIQSYVASVAQSLPVVDVSAFISVHQGSNSSFSHAHALDPKDLYYNKQFQAPFQNGALKCTLHAESSVCNKHFI